MGLEVDGCSRRSNVGNVGRLDSVFLILGNWLRRFVLRRDSYKRSGILLVRGNDKAKGTRCTKLG